MVDSGIYGIIRHPYYASLIPFFIGIALWLESWLGVLAVLPMLIVLVIRVGVEEKFLIKHLPGYPEYMKKINSSLSFIPKQKLYFAPNEAVPLTPMKQFLCLNEAVPLPQRSTSFDPSEVLPLTPAKQFL